MKTRNRYITRSLFFVVLMIFHSSTILTAQDYALPKTYFDPLNLGFGGGVDYGGLGIRLSALPEEHLALFVAVGYNFNGTGFNAGASYRFIPFNKNCFYYTMMYGYNAVIVIANASQYDKTYYGISTGVGLELHSKKQLGNFWNLEILIPIRSQEYKDDLNDFKNNTYIKFDSEPLPISFSIGYHFSIG